jgi:hypothetical protein
MKTGDQQADYCAAHTQACEQWGRDFGPFLGCAACPKPAGFDPKTQPHLLTKANQQA